MKHFSFTLIAALLVLFTSCKHEKLELYQENRNYRPAVDFIKNNYDLSLFYAAIQRAGMETTLNGPGPFTILAPNNQAFNELGILRPDDLAKIPAEQVKRLVQLHVLPRRLREADIAENSVDVRYQTMAGKELQVTMATNKFASPAFRNDLYFHGCLTELKDVTVTNGVLHVLNQVIKHTPGTVQDFLSQHEEFSLFVSALKRFGYWEQLSNEGPWTILAPSNNALREQKLDEQAIAAMNPDKFIIPRLFGCYIMPKQHYFLSDIRAFKVMNGSNALFSNIMDDSYIREIASEDASENGVIKIGYYCAVRQSRIHYPMYTVKVKRKAVADYSMDNGVVHQLDGMLVKPEDAGK